MRLGVGSGLLWWLRERGNCLASSYAAGRMRLSGVAALPMAGTARLWQEPSSSENLLVLSQGIATLNGHLLRARRKTKME